jgi:hypothetical protein
MVERKRKAGKADRTQEAAVRAHILDLLGGEGAHLSFEAATRGVATRARGRRPAGLSLTPWRLLEHMRIAQWDILEFSRSSAHVSPKWPGGYWPPEDGPASAAAWARSLRSFRSDRRQLEEMVRNPRTDLYAPIPHGTGQTILREALLVADHDAYHLGQMVLVRRLLGDWKD